MNFGFVDFGIFGEFFGLIFNRGKPEPPCSRREMNSRIAFSNSADSPAHMKMNPRTTILLVQL
jgi:hypothetical protein